MNLPWREVQPFPDVPGPKIVTSLTLAETAKLRELARGKKVLEIGAANGYSTVIMADVADYVVSVDHHGDVEHSLINFRHNIRNYGLTNKVVPVVADSKNALSKLRFQFDLVFIDGDHSYAGVRYDAVQCQEWLTHRPGVMAFHDYNEDSCPDVTRFLDEHFGQAFQPVLVDTLYVVELN